MPISQTMNEAMNRQIGNEFGAMLQYYAIAAYFDIQALPELHAHFFKQAEEENEHAQRFIKYLTDIGAEIALPAVAAPQSRFDTAAEAVELSLNQEIKVTEQINQLVRLSKQEADYTSENFLQWFVEEQLEEVSSMHDLLSLVKRAGEANLLLVEDHMARKKGVLRPAAAVAVT
jgi:ferritin